MNKKNLLTSLLIIGMLTVPMFVNVLRADEPPTTEPPPELPPTQPPTFTFPPENFSLKKPSLPNEYPRKIPTTVDADGNRVHDALDELIMEASQDDTSSKYVKIIVETNDQLTESDMESFERLGGKDITSGGEGTTVLCGQMACDKVYDFLASCDNIAFIEPDLPPVPAMGFAAVQTGARLDAWTVLGNQGDSNSTIAVIEASGGIDPTHTATLGFGDKDFSKKIVGWCDNVSSTTTPSDTEGHGTMVASAAAGREYNKTDSNGWKLIFSRSSELGADDVDGAPFICPNYGYLYVSIYLESSANITAACALYQGYNSDLEFWNWTQISSYYVGVNQWTNTSVLIPPMIFDELNITQFALLYGVSPDSQAVGEFYVEVRVPYTSPDSYARLSGIAPLAKLFGANINSVTTLNNTLVWIQQHKTDYHINVITMSFAWSGVRYPDLEKTINDTVEAGIICVAAGENYRSDGYYVGTPGTAQLCIQVSADTIWDHVTDYNSLGISGNSTQPSKPDCLAPGGSYLAGLYLADTNANDGYYSEKNVNDSVAVSGTSFSSPIVAGGANLIIDAMGGYAKWNYTKEEALRVKMLILATSTETYPNARLGGGGGNPTQDRGSKDLQEGYGRVNFDAAVDAVLKEYHNGTYWLGASPTENQTTSHIGEPLCWARNYYMTANHQYWFKMTPPDNSDYDLYLCNNTGDKWGEPVWVGKSTNDSDHVEEFYYTPSSSGLCYLIVKRADADSPAGSFFIESADKTTDSRTRYAVANADDYHCELYSSGTYHWDQLYDRGDWNWYETLPISYGNYVAATGDGNTNYDKYWICQTWNTTNPFYNASGFTATIRAWCRDSSAKYELGNFRLFYWTYDLGFVYSSTFEPPTTYSLYNFTIANFTPWNGTRLNDMFYFGIEMTAGYDERRDIHYPSYCETLYIEISFTGWQYDS